MFGVLDFLWLISLVSCSISVHSREFSDARSLEEFQIQDSFKKFWGGCLEVFRMRVGSTILWRGFLWLRVTRRFLSKKWLASFEVWKRCLWLNCEWVAKGASSWMEDGAISLGFQLYVYIGTEKFVGFIWKIKWMVLK